MYDVVIIGGGASGLVAGITAKFYGKNILILESYDRVGKKLLATGNGKCNLANVNIKADNYNNPFVTNFIDKQEKFYNFLEKIGLKIKQVDDRIYPYSENAATVLNLLRDNFSEDEIITNCKAETIKKQDDVFVINDTFFAKNVILASGSNASFGQNSHHLAEVFGHKTIKLKPSIVPLITDTTFIKKLTNIRAKVSISLMKDHEIVCTQNGEILFKDNGISGICVFMLSSYLARNDGNCKVSVDFAPDLSKSELEEFLKKHSIFGLLHKSIAESIIFQAETFKCDLAYNIKNFVIDNLSLSSIKFAQVTNGGLDTNDFDSALQSKLVKNLYACGEVLNIDGDCGGYNLFWAFVSGIIAGENIC
jgi:predicted Rossmann fold flavoprotein